MIFKQHSDLITVTSITILVHLFFVFIEQNSNLHLGLLLFDISNFDILALCCSAVLFLSITTLLKLSRTCLIDDNWTLLKSLQEFVYHYIIVIAGVIPVCVIYAIEIPFEEKIKCCFVTVYSSIFYVVMIRIKGYDEVDYTQSQNSNCSIGAFWAAGSVKAYYEKCLKQCRERLKKFEENHPGVNFLVKKVVLICPLSCKIEGSLEDRCDDTKHIGHLEPIEVDQGGNYNRRLKTSVYKISKNNIEYFVAAEFPSPLGTLWGERFTMKEKVMQYHRDCFLKELKEHLKSDSILILEYDDRKPSTAVPLNNFIVESLQKHKIAHN
ncbi:hypothetical protein JTE90_011594 [Oedothorax gibbosus]|uniref:STING ligand-binding domain-containing protein n=1 Tax=Oedothorax gibbosus TaxID=931172 RepID=A0AAV6U6R4_9ARAC|nr:hypothetical protein JTE90_011594 [Oedothorax gibbosus]